MSIYFRTKGLISALQVSILMVFFNIGDTFGILAADAAGWDFK